MSSHLENLKKVQQSLIEQANNWQAKDKNLQAAEEFRILFLGTKGLLKQAFDLLKAVSPESKKDAGLIVNEIKTFLEEKYQILAQQQSVQQVEETQEDSTLPGIPFYFGNRHPLQQTMDEIIRIFEGLGYAVREACEIEDDWHNFSALNIPEWHPARDMQDTFYITEDKKTLLRTHTSNVQIRTLLNEKLPIRIIAPGRVYRNETISARSHCFFHQVEGLYVNTSVSLADLKHDVYAFVKAFFGTHTKIRFRPSYFPFTEPSAEMDVSCFLCEQKGCAVCKHSGWVEILGCGMVHPNVLSNCNIDATLYNGFAFGMGIERLTMLKYQINDIRRFSENDIAFLSQFH